MPPRIRDQRQFDILTNGTFDRHIHSVSYHLPVAFCIEPDRRLYRWFVVIRYFMDPTRLCSPEQFVRGNFKTPSTDLGHFTCCGRNGILNNDLVA